MKQGFRIISGVFLIALYGAILFGYGLNSTPFEIASAPNVEHAQQFTKVGFPDLLSLTAQTERIVAPVKSSVAGGLKHPDSGLSVAKPINRFYNSFYTQYNFYAQKLVVRMLRTDIIYPFHYFW
ncbi:MAG: hypothetical protein IPI65_21695 [Bacteroidetes bacterium]|nr:hypothetical protein [Bacteroidota bacterium]